MNEKKITKLDNEMLELVSGGKAVSAIEGYSYSVRKNEKNKIFKYEVVRGDGTLMSEHIFEDFANNAAKDYRRAEWENQTTRYELLNEIVRKKIQCGE
jgi:hypothetical protein